jgi:PRC-barrel domain
MLPVRRGTILACIALLLTAAAPEPPASEVQQVAPEDAMAILGHNVDGPDGKDIGRLVDVLVSLDGQPQAAVIDFGGFLGVGSRKIAVRWSALHFAPGDAKHPVTVELTPDQIKGAPEYKDIAKPAPVVVAAPAQPVSPAQPAGTEGEASPPKQ